MVRLHSSAPSSIGALVGLLLAGCGGPDCPTATAASEPHTPATASPEARAQARADIAAVLDDWHDAAADADENRYFAHFAADAVFLGTDATERWERNAFREYARPHFAQGRAWTFRSVRREIVVAPDGETAWFDEDLETESLGPARGSGVMVRAPDGDWRIAQYNLAITVPNDRFSEVRTLLSSPPPEPAGGEDRPGASP